MSIEEALQRLLEIFTKNRLIGAFFRNGAQLRFDFSVTNTDKVVKSKGSIVKAMHESLVSYYTRKAYGSSGKKESKKEM